MRTAINKISTYLNKEVSIAPLIVFRIAFGVLMLASTLRFMIKGWVYDLYVAPKVYFPFFGWDWIKPLGETGMYVLFALMAVSALCITLGLLYRISTLLFFLSFTYTELIDKTNYLNHYYFIIIASFLLIFLPAHHYLSLDNRILRVAVRKKVANSAIFILRFQVAILYFFAGLAKVNADWLLNAMPLKIWLRPYSYLPLVGGLMEKAWLAYFFSWFGCIYDLLIPFLLFNKKTTAIAYFFVVVFHALTAFFFNIGMFPYVMMVITLIFFSDRFHERILHMLSVLLRLRNPSMVQMSATWKPARLFAGLMFIHFFIQLLLPFRYLFYKGDLFWTEQGYRFSWRVMLMEKAGTAFFYVKDKKTNREVEVMNGKYLTVFQQKMVSTQPDMLIDYAHFLKREYSKSGFTDPAVRAEVYVTLNGRPSTLLVDPQADLSSYKNDFTALNCILPLKK